MAIANITGNILTDSGVSTSSLVTGTGTTNYLPKFTGASTLGNSVISENSNEISINVAFPTLIFNGSRDYALQSNDTSGSFRFLDNTAGAERMVITSAGNIGIGTSSPQMPLSVQANTGNGAIRLIGTSNGGTNNAGIYWYDSNDSTFNGYLGNFSTSFDIYNQRSTPIAFYTAGTERMRIQSNGIVNLGSSTDYLMIANDSIGTWIENSNATSSKRRIRIQSLSSSGTNYTTLRVDGTNSQITFETGDVERGRFTSGGYFKASVDGTYLSTGAYHEIRSNSIGNLLVMQQTASSGTLYGIDVYYANQAPNNTTSTFMTCYDNVNIKAIIYSNGTFGSRTNTYGGVSDVKLKENIVPATPKLDDLMKVNVVNYNFIDDDKKEKQLGVISQELEEIFPNMVFESEDKETGEKIKNVKYSVFVPMLIKAIQELSAKVSALENKS